MSRANVNVSLQKSNNYKVILAGDKQFNSQDVTFYIQNFPIPEHNIEGAEIGTLQNKIKFPSQAVMEHESLDLSIIADDNLNSYRELMRWLHELKNPEYLQKPHGANFDMLQTNTHTMSKKELLYNTNQFPIPYRDLSVYVTDRNHQNILRFNFVDSWVSTVGGLDLDSTSSDYLFFDTTFEYLYMQIFNDKNEQIIPPLDDFLRKR